MSQSLKIKENNVLNKVKEGTTDAAKKVGKGINDLKIKDKLKVAGNAIAGAAKTSSHFIAENSMKAVNKTKEGVNNLAQKTKAALIKGGKQENKETNNTNQTEEKKEEKKEEEKEEEKKEEAKEEKKEEEKKEEVKEENKEENKEEKKEENDKKDDAPKEKSETTEEKKDENAGSA